MNNEIKNRISSIKVSLLQLSVIIVNYNVKYFLEQCLSSVVRACKDIDAEIIVVDNHSTDGSKIFFENRFPHVRFVWNSANIGFSKANNQALLLASGENILFLNPDTLVPEECFVKSLSYLYRNTTAGATGIRMIDGSGKFLKESKRGFPSLFASFCKLSGITGLFPSSKWLARYYAGHLDQHSNHEIDILSGAFLMVRKTVLEKTGGFDERFFMYGEDIDLSYRIQQAGFKNLYYSESTIIHFKGESTKAGSLNYMRHFYGAMSLFVKKHYDTGFARFYNFVIPMAIFVKAFFSGILAFIFRVFKRQQRSIPFARTLVVADEKEFKHITSTLQKNRQRIILGRISINENETETNFGKLSELHEIINGQSINEIIFCLDGLQVTRLISLLEDLPPGIKYWYHFNETIGIIGSNLKNLQGESIS